MTDSTEGYALVTATCGGVRYVLLIDRGDGGGWAMPGGSIEPGERHRGAAQRELFEETELFIRAGRFVADEPRRMPDPDGAVTVVARCDLGEVDVLPEVRAGSDARRAGWWPIGIHGVSLGLIFPAHRKILGAL